MGGDGDAQNITGDLCGSALLVRERRSSEHVLETLLCLRPGISMSLDNSLEYSVFPFLSSPHMFTVTRPM